jgi:hypothetical protein
MKYFITLLLICIFLLASCSQNAATELKPAAEKIDCPFEIINDTYPGQCGRYVDQNKNDICDLSQ